LTELDLLRKVKIIVPLGQIAFTQTLKSLRLKGYDVPALSFGHGKLYLVSRKFPTPVGNGLKPFPTELRTISLITTYHPSQQNTQTGKLTRSMFHRIFRMIKKKLEVED
jgi:uracil-DNA glycosylase